MPRHHGAGRRFRRTLAVAAALIAVATVVLSTGAQATSTPASSALYIVATVQAPLAAYTGGVDNIPATKPGPGKKLDGDSTAAREYRGYLSAQRRDVLRSAGIADSAVIHRYETALSGFAARLTRSEVDRLEAQADVLHVWKNEFRQADTISTPAFLGLSGAGGAWQQQFGGTANAGLGVIVGVIDTGVWPENPSFAALPEPRPDQAIIDAKWNGTCVAGDDHPVTCNNKLIGARFYDAAKPGGTVPDEFSSPRDFDGHGSHTASTAAGNTDVPAVINGVEVGRTSGMAPAARVAMYKALWHMTNGTSGGATVDLVAAIDDAVEDGVDVINFSISGSQNTYLDPVELAFFNAAQAGVFVAASAGNSGPAESTVAHNAPWTTTVAASTHDRSFSKSLTLGNGVTFTGVGVGPAVASAPLIDSVNAGLPGADPTQVELCFVGGVLDPAKVTGKIVLCKRGVNARVDKSRAVRDAGGIGMVLYNNPDSTLNADFHFVPTVHVQSAAGLAIKAYAASTSNPTASLSASTTVSVRAPAMAAFSSRGPAVPGGGDLLKPDITAPGVDVIAAVAPPNHAGNMFDAVSGTSMSSPHIAGIAALVRSAHPSWPPMFVKSALMTTAGQVDNTDAPIQRAGAPATPWDMGSGHVRPAPAFDPGVVYDSGPGDWVRFLCGADELQGEPCEAGSIDPSDLNVPSIAIGDLAGPQTIHRTLTNVTDNDAQYDASLTAPPGVTATVSPTKIVVPAGGSASYTVTLTRTTATLGQYVYGSLTWVEKQQKGKRAHQARSPIAVRPVIAGPPAEVTRTGASGSTVLPVKLGYTGTLNAAANGLVPSTVTTFQLVGVNSTFNASAPAAGPAVGKATVTVPAGSTLARFRTYGSEHLDNTDLDMFVYQAGTTTLVAQSAGGTADESVTLTAAGTYDVYIVQFALPAGATEQPVRLHSWVVGGPVGNLTATPASQPATFGTTVNVTASWSGLSGGRYLGVVRFTDATSTDVARTIVGVNVDPT